MEKYISEKMCEWCGENMVEQGIAITNKKVVMIICCYKSECRVKESIKYIKEKIIRKGKPKRKEVIGL